MIPEQTTKVERVVEAVESFANAIIGVQNARDHMRAAAMQNVKDGRQELCDALGEFLAPVLRVATVNGARPSAPSNVHTLRP